jgi:diaminopimelate dehydrogenase
VHRRRLAVLGLGRLGRACANAILEADDLVLSGIIRRAETLRQPLPAAIADIPVVAHPGELSGLDAVLICLPAERVLEAAKDLLQHHTPIVEAAILAPDRREIHWQEIDRKALRRDVPAVVGAGWDPGLRASFESLLTISCPRGSTK